MILEVKNGLSGFFQATHPCPDSSTPTAATREDLLIFLIPAAIIICRCVFCTTYIKYPALIDIPKILDSGIACRLDELDVGIGVQFHGKVYLARLLLSQMAFHKGHTSL